MTPLQPFHDLFPVTLASLSFVYVYLPICLLAYYLSPKKLRPCILLAFSLGFYALSQPGYFLLIVACVLLDIGFTQCIVIFRRHFWRRSAVVLCVMKNLALIGYFGVMAQLRQIQAPLGLLICCVSGIDCALEAYREETPQLRNAIRLALYILFFPRLYAGPIIKPEEFCAQCADTEYNAGGIAKGFGRFIEGAFKYTVFGHGLFLLYNSVALIPKELASVLSAWIFVISFAMALYFTLSGLSDMACGIAGMLGFTLPINFYYPYQSRTVSDFFERFNITLGGFLKRNVLVPLSPDKKDRAGDSINLLLMGMLWGLWFGLRFNYMLWGGIVALFIIMEKHVYPGVIKAMPTLFSRGYALFATLIGFTVFSSGSLAQSLEQFRLMFGMGMKIQLFNDRILYVLSSNLILLAFSCLFATNMVNLVVNFTRKNWPRASLVVMGVVDAGILIVFTAMTLGGGRL